MKNAMVKLQELRVRVARVNAASKGDKREQLAEVGQWIAEQEYVLSRDEEAENYRVAKLVAKIVVAGGCP